MRFARGFIVCGVIWSCVALDGSSAAANPIPVSYTQTSPDGRFVFVMNAPGSNDDQSWLFLRVSDMRSKKVGFARSGLYRNDGSSTPLWTVDWYARTVFVCSDGVHLVRPGAATWDLKDEAVSIYASGRLVRSYRIDDFVDFTRFLPRSETEMKWLESASFDDQRLTHTIRTHDGNRFVIDLHTGQIVSSSRPYRTGIRIVLGIAIAGVSFWVGRLAWKYQKHRRAMHAMERPLLNG